jgi:hypothetical protein
LNHDDTGDTEIISGGEDDLPPIHDITDQANDKLGVDIPIAAKQFDALVTESVVIEPQPQSEADLDERPSTSQEPAVVVEIVSETVDTPFTESDVTESQPQAETDLGGQLPVAQEPAVVVETLSESSEPVKVQPQLTGWQRVQSIFFGSSADTAARLNNLTQAVEDAPDSAVNYVLRAEVYMDLREYALAQADFQRAVDLAQVQFELADWGFLDQAMRDRAVTGLEKVQRRLR